MAKPRRPQNKQITAAQHRLTVRHILVSRESLDTLDQASLARSMGLNPAEIQALVAEEAMRRAARG